MNFTKNIPLIRPTHVSINLKNLAYNYKFIKNKIKKNTEILSVVKADGYGHGSIEVTKKLISLGARYLGVASIEEAIVLRDAGIKNPILILGSIYPYSSFQYLEKYNLIPTVSSLMLAQKLNTYFKSRKRVLKVHIKLDTGMRRIGINSTYAVPIIEKIAKFTNIEIHGLFTHIADFTNRELTNNQINKFNKVKLGLKKYQIKYFHISNSGTFFNYKNSEFNMIRPGVALYGLNSFSKKVKLKPVLDFKSKIVFLKKVKKGQGISYAHTYKTYRDSLIATVPVGYGDGYNTALSNSFEALMHGKFVNQVGTICMDMTMFDVTDIKNVKLGDEVTLIGTQGKKTITIEQMAQQIGTINYEVVCNINKRVPRVYK